MAVVMIGVDPHKASHTAVAISAAEERLGELRVRASAVQAERMLAWAAAWPERTWAVEGAGGLGHLLAQQLLAAGERVLDVQPKLGARVRLLAAGDTNKNDPNDARSVAVAALRSPGVREVRADDHAAVLKMWSNGTATWAGLAPRWSADCTRCCANWSLAASRRRSSQLMPPGWWTPSRRPGPLTRPAATWLWPSSMTCAASTRSCATPGTSSPPRSGRPGPA
jgi:Transposase